MMMDIGNKPRSPVPGTMKRTPLGDHTLMGGEPRGFEYTETTYGATIAEELVMRVACAYIAAGSNGMPSPKEIVELTCKTVDGLLKLMETYSEGEATHAE